MYGLALYDTNSNCDMSNFVKAPLLIFHIFLLISNNFIKFMNNQMK